MISYKILGLELKKIRLSSHFSQQQVYELTNISVDTLRRLENGYSVPRIETLEILSSLYKFNLFTLLNKSNVNHFELVGEVDILLEKDIKYNEYNNIYSLNDNLDKIYNNLVKSNMDINDDIFRAKILQYKKYVDIVSQCDINNPDVSKIPLLIDDLHEIFSKLHTNFNMVIIEEIELDLIDYRILVLIAEFYRLLKEHSKSIKILVSILNSTSLEKIFDSVYKTNLLTKVYYTLSYNYHNIDDHKLALQYALNGISYCQKTQVFTFIHLLYFRAASAYNYLDLPELSIKYFSYSVSTLVITGDYSIAEKYTKIICERYNIHLNL